jgi:deoxyribodipyrimidine photo-lyase
MTAADRADPASSELERVDWTPTRAAGLARLAGFAPRAGRDYARDRNEDRGPRLRANVSALSPWIRRRLVTESEVIDAVLERHRFEVCEKFIQEVFWRSYWKGWLEMRPSVYARYEEERDALSARWAGHASLVAAEQGRSGLDCFDAWVRELIEIGWLHNHSRMWFASIWIFTLRLPWQLGADFFDRHLLDSDPASNTLSWRWVAGLHTPGKHYLARAENIRTHTLGRFDPRDELDERAEPLSEDGPTPAATRPPNGDRTSADRVALLLTEEDLHPESWGLGVTVAAAGGLVPLPGVAGEGPALRFAAGAIADGLDRAGACFGCGTVPLADDGVAAWAAGLGVQEVVTGYAPVGPTAGRLRGIESALAARQIRLVRLQRSFDARVWPHARAGFFKLRGQIPDLVGRSR